MHPCPPPQQTKQKEGLNVPAKPQGQPCDGPLQKGPQQAKLKKENFFLLKKLKTGPSIQTAISNQNKKTR